MFPAHITVIQGGLAGFGATLSLRAPASFHLVTPPSQWPLILHHTLYIWPAGEAREIGEDCKEGFQELGLGVVYITIPTLYGQTSGLWPHLTARQAGKCGPAKQEEEQTGFGRCHTHPYIDGEYSLNKTQE